MGLPACGGNLGNPGNQIRTDFKGLPSENRGNPKRIKNFQDFKDFAKREIKDRKKTN